MALKRSRFLQAYYGTQILESKVERDTASLTDITDIIEVAFDRG